MQNLECSILSDLLILRKFHGFCGSICNSNSKCIFAVRKAASLSPYIPCALNESSCFGRQ